MFTLSSVPNRNAAGVHCTPKLLTSYESAAESRIIVHEPPQGPPVVMVPSQYPPGQPMRGALSGTWVTVWDTWAAARAALALIEGRHSIYVWLHRPDGTSLQVVPRRHRHTVLPDDGDMHQITVEWVQVGGLY